MDYIWGFTGKPATRASILDCVYEGWYPIVISLLDDLEGLGWDGQVDQVKEKFGGLRFYIGVETETISARIQQAEGESYRTCELCGESAEPRTYRGWIHTWCEACAAGA